MPLEVAIAGLKHDHVRAVIRTALEDPSVKLVALSDDDERNRHAYEKEYGIEVRYSEYRSMLESVNCDVLVVCDRFGRRGRIVMDGLAAGKHIFSDKPLCTSEEDLREIAALAAAKRREIDVDFSLRHWMPQAAQPLQQGEIGRIVSCVFSGGHALNYPSRPHWYYTPDDHGGIINDLMGHGLDYLLWVGKEQGMVVLSAACACVGLPQEPGFQTVGEAHFQFESGATAFGQVHYLVPPGHPAGWQIQIVGSEGDATIDEVEGVRLRRAGEKEKKIERRPCGQPFVDFIRRLADGRQPMRTTAEALKVSMAALVAQRAAETGQTRVAVPEIPEIAR